jgi:hypothetical protein
MAHDTQKTPKPTTRTRKPRSTGAKEDHLATPPSILSSTSTLASDPLDPTAAAPVEFTATALGKSDQALLRRTMRFLVNVVEPGLADRARREGYSREEHQLGWQLWRTAAGETRSFEHWLCEQQLVDGIDVGSVEQRRRLQEIDEFENTWFPRTRTIIRRVVSKERRDAFSAAFFKDLVQQPLGPAVVGSVGTYLTRLAGLETSTDPNAKAVRATLRSRGLTDGKVAAVAQLLEETKAGATGSKEPSPPVSAAELEKARLAQLDALDALRDWWNDWGVTLRSRYGLREQLKLGLTLGKKRGPSSGDDELDDEGDEPTDSPVRSLSAADSLVAQ